MIANLKAMGHTVDINEDAAREVAEYFTALGEAEGLPMGKPMHFDAAYLRHQLPGGMVGTMRRHLTDHGVPHLMERVIEEMGRVREELGWPIVMTPFAQMLQTQAVLNVTGKERYGVIPDEIIRYALGRFGRPNVPIEADVMDRIMANPRTKELQAEPGMAELSELRTRIGKTLSDEEFLLRATMPAEMVDAMKAKGPAPREYDPSNAALMNLLRDLLQRTDVDELEIEKENFRLELSAG
jgi:oxaloacetate decarboxylase alpha subunit